MPLKTFEVMHYSYRWNHTIKRGRLKLKLKDERNLRNLDYENPAELNLITRMLEAEKPIFLVVQDNGQEFFRTDREQVGDGDMNF